MMMQLHHRNPKRNLRRKESNMPAGIGIVEISIIAFLIILFFGGKKIPELFKGMGDAVREFKKGAREDKGGEKKT